MPSIKSIKQRIKSTAAVTKVTKVVQLIAAAKLRPAKISLESMHHFCYSVGHQMLALASLMQNSKTESLVESYMAQNGVHSDINGHCEITKLLLAKILESGQSAGLNLGHLGQQTSGQNNGDEGLTIIVVLGSNRGLCGSLNGAVAKFTQQAVLPDVLKGGHGDAKGNRVKIVCIGKKAYSAFKDKASSAIEVIPKPQWHSEKTTLEMIKEICGGLSELIDKDCKTKEIIFVFQDFRTVLRQDVVALPLFQTAQRIIGQKKGDEEGHGNKASENGGGYHKKANDHKTHQGNNQPEMAAEVASRIFLNHKKRSPNKGAIPLNTEVEGSFISLAETIAEQFYLGFVGYAVRSMLVSENAIRMTSMDAATKNGEKLIQKLELQANKSRQSAITGELMDLIGGSMVAHQ